MRLPVTQNIFLELTSLQHAAGLFELVDTNREHLSRFLPWVNNMQSVADFENYTRHCETQYDQKTDISFVIKVDDRIAGRIGLHYIHPYNKIAAIGYWLSKEFEGQGIILQSCRVIISYGFKQLHLNRIEIKAAAENIRSQTVPQKLGFTSEGILREAEWVNNGFVDLHLYSLLKKEWPTGK